MPLLPKVDPRGVYELSGETLNALIEAANSWQNLRVELVVSSDEVTKLIRREGRSVLRIAIPSSSGSIVGFSEMAITFCDDENNEVTKIFLVKDET